MPATNGLIRYYGLTEWWLHDLSDSERARLEEAYHPMGETHERPLTEGDVGRINATMANPAGFLSALPGWLRANPADNVTRLKICDKLAGFVSAEPDPTTRHFCYQVLIKEYYRDRNNSPESKAKAIDACRAQISLSPLVARAMKAEFPDSPLPMHVGFEQLAIVLEKDEQFEEAIALCEKAAAEGWNGDWTRRIARIDKRRCRTK